MAKITISDATVFGNQDGLVRILKGLRDEQNSVQESVEALRSQIAEQAARITWQGDRLSLQRRDEFARAALQGLCATPAGLQAGQDTSAPGQLAFLAIVIADATINALDKIAPPKPIDQPRVVSK